MAAPIWELPIRERYDTIVDQLAKAAKAGDVATVSWRMSEIDEAVLSDYFEVIGISDPLDNIGRQQLVVSNPTDPDRLLRTISLVNVAAIDPFTPCEGHTSTIGSVEEYTEYCDGRCRA